MCNLHAYNLKKKVSTIMIDGRVVKCEFKLLGSECSNPFVTIYSIIIIIKKIEKDCRAKLEIKSMTASFDG